MSYLPISQDKIKNVRANLDVAIKALSNENISFDGIVIRGMSGALVAHYVYDKTSKPIMVVRKGESSHGCQLEAPYPAKVERYIILDDCISSGNTIISIKQKMDIQNEYGHNYQVVAIVLYANCPIESEPDAKAWEEAGLKGIPIFTYDGRRYHDKLSPFVCPAPELESIFS